MQLEVSIFDLLILIGILQGAITGILLLNSPKNKRSNPFLALALFAFGLLCTKPLLHNLYLWDSHVFRFFPNGIELALPPLVYLYVKSLVKPDFRFRSKQWLHFIPFFFSQAYAFWVYFSVLQTRDLAAKDSIAEGLAFGLVKEVDEYLLLVSVACYLWLGYRELVSYKRWLDDHTSDSTFPDFKWLRIIFRLSLVMGGFLLVNHSLDLIWDLRSSTIWHWQAINLFIAFWMYFLGLKGYLQADASFSRGEESSDEGVGEEPEPEADFTETVRVLQRAMAEEKGYLNPKLGINELAKSLGLPPKQLSAAINQHFKMNFRDFINEYRVEEVKAKLLDPANDHLSILGIAEECGFNSEASFYRIFKKKTGLSPKAFVKGNRGE